MDKNKLLLLFSLLISLIILNNTLPNAEVGISSDEGSLNLKISDFKPYKFIAFGDTRTASGDNSGLEKVANLIEELMNQHEITCIYANIHELFLK